MFTSTLQDHKKAINEIRSIFSFTQIQQKRSLPVIKSSQGLRTQKSILDKNAWQDFLKRKVYSGNLSPRQITPKTCELMSRLEEKAKQEFTAKPIEDSMKFKNFSKEMENFKLSILAKKNKFNKAHDAALKKEKKLEGLLNKFDELCILETEISEQAKLEKKNLECEEIEIGLENELIVRETLLFMITRLKHQNIELSKPFIETQKKIAELKFEILALKNNLFLSETSNVELQKELESTSQSFNSLLDYKAKFIEEKSKIYEERIKMKLSIEQEKEKNKLVLKQKNNEKKLKEIEEKLSEFKNAELIDSEILSFEQFCTGEEEKFKKIQKVTNVRRVGEILEHFNYLVGNKEKLMDSVKAYLAQIERLSQERAKLNEELSYLKFSMMNDGVLRGEDVEGVDQVFRKKILSLENFEGRIHKMQEIVIYAVNTFARVGRMLRIDTRLGKIRKENLIQSMEACLFAYDSLKSREVSGKADVKDKGSNSAISSDISVYENDSIKISYND